MNEIIEKLRAEMPKYNFIECLNGHIVVEETWGYKNAVFCGCQEDFLNWAYPRTQDDETAKMIDELRDKEV